MTEPTGAVLVIGGGIAGMQASLDLADQDFKVYLVEKSPSIGGRMAQLDVTFPTNDCAMCIEGPKMVEVARHPNIELLTYSEVVGLEGSVGNFKAKVLRKPRYVLEEKCNGCGECAKKCPVTLPNEFDLGLGLKKAIYVPFPQATPLVHTIDKRDQEPPCGAACPAGINVQGYVALIADGKFKEALDLVKQKNPLPAICGRVCHHPCEDECNRGQFDEPIAIASLKRFIADYELEVEEGPTLVEKTKDQKVAIIGSGPAGLTAAHDLVKMGYSVTVFEKLPAPGGMLQVGIPEYRLPKSVLKREIDAIESLGVEIKINTEIGKDLTFEDLSKEYDAIFIAIGTHKSLKLNVQGDGLKGVIHGVEFLRDLNLGNKIELGQRVAVIGGGNVAIDSARSALRLGSKEVFILYRRSREEMPANEWEIRDAEQEGIKIYYLAAPTKILGKDGKVVGMECIRMELGEPDASGRRRPIPIKGSEFRIDADTVIPAIGQAPDLAFPEDVELTERGTISADENCLTKKVGIFAGGDAVSGPATAIEAIAAGKKAAISIDRYLRGEGLEEEVEAVETVKLDQIDLRGIEKAKRSVMPKLPVAERIRNFEEVELGLTQEMAIEEAKRCLNCGLCAGCRECERACEANAIDFSQLPTQIELQVGSIIVATGYEVLEPTMIEEYCYGVYKDVITALQYERLLSASGPTLGKIRRPSDSEVPKRVAWIQCVGSRDVSRGYPYCSRVCCTYATKQAMLTLEHDPNTETYVFYIDRRTYGKDFEEYYTRANDAGVKYIRGQPGEVFKNSGVMKIKYEETATGEVKELSVDLLVLSAAIVPNRSNKQLAEILGIELDENSFFQEKDLFSAQVESSREGIYLAGCAQGPKDIPDSVAQGCGAAAQAAIPIHTSRGKEIQKVELVPEKDVRPEDEPRIGVFICHCGINIAGVVDVESVTSYAEGLPDVVCAEQMLFACSEDGTSWIKEAIKEHDLNRVVVASCTPTTHKPLFQDICREAGLNPYLFEMASIREHSSWVHSQKPELATQKAMDLVRMAVAKARLLEPLKRSLIKVNHTALVIGGGIAGMICALDIAANGFRVHLIEREPQLGGMLRKINKLFPLDVPACEVINPKIEAIKTNENIQVHLETEVTDVKGYVGNFQVSIGNKTEAKTLEVGAIVVATGSQEIDAKGLYGYGTDERIITQLELEERLSVIGDQLSVNTKHQTPKTDYRLPQPKADPPLAEITDYQNVVMINCCGAREDEGRTYCCRIGCGISLKNAKYIKELYPASRVTILYQDMVVFGKREEEYYTDLKGVNFIRYSTTSPPTVVRKGDKIAVNVYNELLHEESEIVADLVVLTVATEGATGSDQLQKMLRVSLGVGDFFTEVHPKIRPLDFVTDGVYLCGSAHFPKGVADAISQAQGAAGRACRVLSQEELESEAMIAQVSELRCVGCEVCVQVCPYEARELDPATKVAMVNEALCQGCGACVAACPNGASSLRGYKEDQMAYMIDAAFEGLSERR